LYSMVNETENRNRILEMCKFVFWLVHWIDPCSVQHSYACVVNRDVVLRPWSWFRGASRTRNMVLVLVLKKKSWSWSWQKKSRYFQDLDEW